MLLYLLPTSCNYLKNRARLGLFLIHKYCICFIIELDLFVLKLVDASTGGLAYARQDTLDMNILWLQVCWDKVNCLFTLIVFCLQGDFPLA